VGTASLTSHEGPERGRAAGHPNRHGPHRKQQRRVACHLSDYGTDYKAAVNDFAQRKKACSNSRIQPTEYETERVANGWQSTLRIPCWDGRVFHGEVCATKCAAEVSAAKACCDDHEFQRHFEEVHASFQRRASGSSGATAREVAPASLTPPPRGKTGTFFTPPKSEPPGFDFSRFGNDHKRAAAVYLERKFKPAAGEKVFQYDNKMIGSLWVSTLTVRGMSKVYEGIPKRILQDAEQSAAERFCHDPDVLEEASRLPSYQELKRQKQEARELRAKRKAETALGES